jgi:hypothetical protein
MYRIGFAAIVFVAVSAGVAHAEALDAQDLYRRAEALVQSLFGGPAADHEIIAPPGHIDSRMALVPPQPGGTMRMIVPPGKLKQQ